MTFRSILRWKLFWVVFGLAYVVLAGLVTTSEAKDTKKIAVDSYVELRTVLKGLEPGTTILIKPGVYKRGIFLRGVSGTFERPIVISGSDPRNPPLFTGRGEGAKLSHCAYLKLKNLVFKRFTSNGINIDDGGNYDTPSHHVILENITVLQTGPRGNHDALKMSGVNHFVVRNCRFEGWGGSGIDLVGCHNGVVEGCSFVGLPGFRTRNAIQIKGGSSSILVQTSFFKRAGERIINLGGSTGLRYFRPPGTDYEAKDIVVAGNRFVGGEAHIAWVTSRDSRVHHNIFYRPEKWLARILQETRDRHFKPCGNGVFESNLILADKRMRVVVNVGPRTSPSSFIFRNNAWYFFDKRKRPYLPVREKGSIYQVDPKLIDSGTPQMRIGSSDPRFKNIGPSAYSPWQGGGDFTDVLIH